MDAWMETRLSQPLDIAGEAFTPSGGFSVVPADRAAVYARVFPSIAAASAVVSVPGTVGGEPVELLGAVSGSFALEVLSSTCQVTYEDLSASQLVEFRFADEGDATWRLSCIGEAALTAFKAHKFKGWKDMLENPTCEAQFRRMLQLGLVNKVYDKFIFPTPDALKPSYTVVDDNGKNVDIPHSVAGLRIWAAADQAYREISPQLDGAPSDADAAKVWGEMLDQWRETRGAEFIDSLLGPRPA